MNDYEEANLKAYVEHLEAVRKIETERTAVIQTSFMQMVEILAAGPPQKPKEPGADRKWLALNAMTSMLSSTPVEDGENWPEPGNVAANACRYADALIAALEKP